MYATIGLLKCLGISLILLGTLGASQAKYSGGRGTAADPYQIATAADPAMVDKASCPDPPDGAVGVTAPLLQWKPATSALFHDVYLGTNPDPTEADLVGPRQYTTMTIYYHVPGLDPGVRYYWRVDEIEADGTVHTGDVWTFLARDVKAYYPSPTDGANDVSPTPALTWLPGIGAAQHHVYFGNGAEAVGRGAAETDRGILTETTFTPGELEPLTTYYWRVDEIAGDGSVQTGEVWHFATYLVVDDFEDYNDEIWNMWMDGALPQTAAP